MSVKLSNKLRSGNDAQRSELKQLLDYQGKLDILHTRIVYNISMLNKVKREVKRLQMNSMVATLFRQCKLSFTPSYEQIKLLR